MRRASILDRTVLAALGLALVGALAAAQSGIFVPKARGSGESLDENATQEGKTAVITTRPGDRLTGVVNSITKDGLLRLTAPHFDREVGVFTSAIREVVFPSAVAEVGKDAVILANDDRIFGKVLVITPNDVALETSAMGVLKIASNQIRQILFGGTAGALVSTDFRTGQMTPLTLGANGSWNVADNILRSIPTPFPNAVFLNLEQKSALTYVVDFARTPRFGSLAIFAASPDAHGALPNAPGAPAGSFICLDFNGGNYVVNQWKGDAAVPLSGNLPGRVGEAMELRIAYDPTPGDVKVWLGDKLVSEAKAQAGPRSGKYVVLTTQDACAINGVRVFDGVVAPQKAVGEADATAITVVFTNRDRVRAEAVTFADGSFSVKTSFGVLPVPPEKLTAIFYPKAGREAPPQPKLAVQVCTSKGVLTVELTDMNDKQLTAKSPFIGPVKFDRAAIKALRFLSPTEPK